MIHTFGLEKGVLGGGGLQTPDFQKKSGVPPDSRLQISRKNMEYRAPDSRLQISRKNLEYGAPDSRLQISRKNLEYRDPGLQILESVIWSLGPRVLQIFSGNLESGVWGPGYSRFFLEIWSLESGAPGTPDFFWKSGVWSPGPWYSRFFLEIWSLESGAPGTPDFFWKSGVWSPGPGYSRSFLEIWSLESGAPVLQIFSGNLESGVRGPGTPDFFWKSGVWSPGPGYARLFLEI